MEAAAGGLSALRCPPADPGGDWSVQPLSTVVTDVTLGDYKASCLRISKVICRQQGHLITATEQFLENSIFLAACRN